MISNLLGRRSLPATASEKRRVLHQASPGRGGDGHRELQSEVQNPSNNHIWTTSERPKETSFGNYSGIGNSALVNYSPPSREIDRRVCGETSGTQGRGKISIQGGLLAPFPESLSPPNH